MLRGIRVADLAAPGPVTTLPEMAPFEDVLATEAASEQTIVPVVDAARKVTGVVTLDEIRRVLNENLPTQTVALASREC